MKPCSTISNEQAAENLRRVAEHPSGMWMSQIAEAIGLDPATTDNRDIVARLAGYVRRGTVADHSVHDSTGAECLIGDVVYLKNNGRMGIVESYALGEDGLVNVIYKLDGRTVRVATEGACLTHTMPVIGADGMPIMTGDTVYAIAEGGPYTVVEITGSESEKLKLMMADNKVFQLGMDDMVNIEEIMAELEDFDIPGFDEDTLDALYGDMEIAVETAMSYGVYTAEETERREEISQRREELYSPDEQNQGNRADRPSEESERPAAQPQQDIERRNDTRRCVSCPRCGESVWV